MSYEIWWDQGNNNWVVWNAAYTGGASLIATGCNPATTFGFKIKTTNCAYTSSNFSSIFSIDSGLSMTVPDPPTALTEILTSKTYS